MTPARKDCVRPLDCRHGRVDMSHGGGGRAMARLIEESFLRAFDNESLRQGNDPATRPLADCRAGELERVKLDVFGFDPSDRVARQHFVAKLPRSRTPLWLARHRAARAG